MTRDAVVQLLHRGRQLAATMIASEEERIAWVGVYPLDPSRPDTPGVLRRFGVSVFGDVGPVYRIRAFEVQRILIEADASISEEELTNKCDALAIGDADLEAKLRALGIDVDRLDLPFKSNYPI
jgi:hypothetical protein